jgi:hypothetical protein
MPKLKTSAQRKRPVPGQPSIDVIRTTIKAIADRIKDPQTRTKDVFKLLKHQSELIEKLRHISALRFKEEELVQRLNAAESPK